jgi:hypothetical protein
MLYPIPCILRHVEIGRFAFSRGKHFAWGRISYRICEPSVNKDFSYKMMVWTRASEAVSSSARLQPHRALLKDAHDTKSKLEVVMEVVMDLLERPVAPSTIRTSTSFMTIHVL